MIGAIGEVRKDGAAPSRAAPAAAAVPEHAT